MKPVMVNFARTFRGCLRSQAYAEWDLCQSKLAQDCAVDVFFFLLQLNNERFDPSTPIPVGLNTAALSSLDGRGGISSYLGSNQEKEQQRTWAEAKVQSKFRQEVRFVKELLQEMLNPVVSEETSGPALALVVPDTSVTFVEVPPQAI